MGWVNRAKAFVAARYLQEKIIHGEVQTSVMKKANQRMDPRLQGDAAMIRPENVRKRAHLSTAYEIRAEIERIWLHLPRQGGRLQQEVYLGYSQRLFQRLMTKNDMTVSTREMHSTLRWDWKSDSGGKGWMDYTDFEAAMFNLADLWVNTVDSADYVKFLRECNLLMGETMLLGVAGSRILPSSPRSTRKPIHRRPLSVQQAPPEPPNEEPPEAHLTRPALSIRLRRLQSKIGSPVLSPSSTAMQSCSSGWGSDVWPTSTTGADDLSEVGQTPMVEQVSELDVPSTLCIDSALAEIHARIAAHTAGTPKHPAAPAARLSPGSHSSETERRPKASSITSISDQEGAAAVEATVDDAPGGQENSWPRPLAANVEGGRAAAVPLPVLETGPDVDAVAVEDLPAQPLLGPWRAEGDRLAPEPLLASRLAVRSGLAGCCVALTQWDERQIDYEEGQPCLNAPSRTRAGRRKHRARGERASPEVMEFQRIARLTRIVRTRSLMGQPASAGSAWRVARTSRAWCSPQGILGRDAHPSGPHDCQPS
eukprot:EG_transcript_6442